MTKIGPEEVRFVKTTTPSKPPVDLRYYSEAHMKMAARLFRRRRQIPTD